MSERELLKGSTDSLFLALLSERSMYGYELLREVERRSDGYFALKEGTLYPALHRLERDNLIEGVWRSSPGGQYRRYYDISDRGLQRLEQGRAEWVNFSRAVSMVIAGATP